MIKTVSALHEDPYFLYTEANAYLAKGCPDIAENIYHKALAVCETGVEVKQELRADIFHNLGMISEQRQNLSAAIGFYRQAVQNDKHRGMTWIFLAKVFLERYQQHGDNHDYQAGFKALNKAAELKPEYPVIEVLKKQYQKTRDVG